ncbi:MAG TPA: alpha/beta hydrolase [Gordonia sp. (in: high G+C Gram-positive bacteria)]|uniref:alpha/beta fold hydrolase n=1 Tax=unclassified Gordonia (in: high G+C Gram-positive bacteria) TaxID=2657482 RepID=UPI0025C45F3C|nr:MULTISPECIES: alpha/beta hydrolase [unclassified Gordonia (in: high G+C Gram-positive bacteria)]HNP56780.1 alpha/beta hydrolase [Gordonia sp. (in: high G+C Gram-positive bacteria)]HRC49903.1 alpha/beta hydrolase [Gordonia sp. (in: high G+C Gram-positive bacteria)]
MTSSSAATDAPAWFTDAVATTPHLATVTVDGAAVAYRTWDAPDDPVSGQPAPGVMLVHGGAAHAGWWDHLGPQLAQDPAQPRRVVAYDLSGHGDSEWRDGYTYAQWAVELVAVARDAGIVDDRLIVIGHSMGGIVSMFASVLYPDVVNQIIVVDSQLFDAADIAKMMAHGVSADNAIPKTNRHYGSLEEALTRYRLLPEQETLPYVRDYVARGSAVLVEDGWRWKFDRAFPTMLTDPVPTPPPTCAVTVIRGEHGIMNPDKAEALVDGRAGPGARVVTLTGAGHHVMLDRPLELLAELRTALDEHSRREHGRP